MKSILISSALIFFISSQVFSQYKKQIVAGPMAGYTELRTAKVWVQFDKAVKKASVHYRPQQSRTGKFQTQQVQLDGGEFNTVVFDLTGLEPGTTYQYYISADQNKRFSDSGLITTQTFWQSRIPPPSFSFLVGSCAYFSEPPYDRSDRPAGYDSSIFETMAREKSDFMVWLGDNWYTRQSDYFSEWGLHYRASRDRGMPVLKNFLKAMPQYAIWDDHDFGPNDSDKSYHLKNTARKVFMKYWANPSYGMQEEGVYTKVTFNDADFFLLDNRWWRSNDRMKDSINGVPNPAKKMFGDAQMEWLKNALLLSTVTPGIRFRIIATGSQVLNQLTRSDALKAFPAEYRELMSFLEDNKINGVLFITGDRHHSEIIKQERKNAYPLYDITISPLSANPSKTQGAESTNPARISKEIAVRNYGRFSVTGEGKERKLTVEIVGIDGNTLDTWSVNASDISY